MPENNFISAVRGYLRLGNFPLDASSVYESFQDASLYAATNPTAYPGQLVAVVDEVARTVTVYQLGFKIDENEAGFDLQPLSTGSQGTLVTSVNGITPDSNGNITLDLEQLDNILTFLENTDNAVVFSKGVQVPTASIISDTSVITREYLDAEINDLVNGVSRTVTTEFNYQGGTTLDIIPGGVLIKRVVVKITEAFQPSDIEILIGGSQLFAPSDIFETTVGTYISEPFLVLSGTSNEKFPVVINISGSPLAGLAKIYIDFNINFTI
jgi:hypothetical protein